MQTAIVARAVAQDVTVQTAEVGEPYQNFLFALNSPVSRERYSSKLRAFFNYIGFQSRKPWRSAAGFSCKKSKESGDNEHNNYPWVYGCIVKFLQHQRDRYDKKEITGSTIRGYCKSIKLFTELNDITLPWTKIKRGLPKGRNYALDRIPTREELARLVEYPDRRIKAIVYTVVSSGIRLGAWDYLRWGHIYPIKRGEAVIAAKVIVYAEEEEQYMTFMDPEAYLTLLDWMNFRARSSETITKESWVMRDLWDISSTASRLGISGFVSSPNKIKILIHATLFCLIAFSTEICVFCTCLTCHSHDSGRRIAVLGQFR